MSAVLTAEQALKLVGEMFVYHMPFNRALGMELERYEKEFAQLAFKNKPMMVGNWAQSILHGGVIASALDVAAGLVCVGSTLTRHETISEDELRQRLSRMGTIDLRVDYLRPGRGERFTATSSLLRAGNKVAVARVELHNEEQLYIASATCRNSINIGLYSHIPDRDNNSSDCPCIHTKGKQKNHHKITEKKSDIGLS